MFQLICYILILQSFAFLIFALVYVLFSSATINKLLVPRLPNVGLLAGKIPRRPQRCLDHLSFRMEY